MKNGKYVSTLKKSHGTVFIELLSSDHAGIYFNKFSDENLK